MNKILWTQEKIKELQMKNDIYDQAGHGKKISKLFYLALDMDMTYNQINSALRRFCGGKNA
jgi:hypothetical protein